MKVLMLSANLDRPEAHLALGLAERGVEITLVLQPSSPFQDILKGSPIKILNHLLHGRIDPRLIRDYRRLLRGGKFAVVHSFDSRALSNALFASIGLGVKHVAYRGTMGHLSRLDPSAWLAHLNPRIARIICVSGAVKSYLLTQGVPERRLTRIYKGHTPAWYDAMQPADLTKAGIPPGAFVVACTANVRAVKGIDVLVEAERYLPREANVHLLLIGEARDAEVIEIAKHTPNRERLHFTGFRPDAISLVKSAAAFCMPSVAREGLPKAMLEAMAVGVPVIVTDVGGMPEVVQDGESGLVIPPGDPRAAAAAIMRLAGDAELRKKFAARGKELVSERFSIDSTISKTHEVYLELANGG